MGWLTNAPKWTKWGPEWLQALSCFAWLGLSYLSALILAPFLMFALWVHNYFIAKRLDDEETKD